MEFLSYLISGISLGSIIIAALYPVLTLCYWLWKGTDAASLVFITEIGRASCRERV